MNQTVSHPKRLGGGKSKRSSNTSTMPPLPVIDWASIGASKPKLITGSDWNPDNNTIEIDMVIMTWTSAEWAAFDHVFCNSDQSMPYEYYENEHWHDGWQYYHNGWDKIAGELTSKSPSVTHKAWGSGRIVEFPANGKKALLFKSDMHISTDGPDLPLRSMVQQLITDFKPNFVFTIGTSGGSRVHDCIGTANITNAARFDLSGEFAPKHYPFNHKTFENDWKPNDSLLKKLRDSGLLMETPVTENKLEELRAANLKELKNPDTGEAYTLKELANAEIAPGAVPPKINALPGMPVLTTNGYVVGNTSGNYDDFAAMEMDDAVIGMISNENKVSWGICRNISDPVQNAGINEEVQGNWGGIVYGGYGLYTSFNGALAAWASVAGS